MIFMAKMADFRYSWCMSDDPENTPSMMTDNTPEARAWRREQANVDADIEGMATSSEARAFVAELDKLNLTTEERIARITAFHQQREEQSPDQGSE